MLLWLCADQAALLIRSTLNRLLAKACEYTQAGQDSPADTAVAAAASDAAAAPPAAASAAAGMPRKAAGGIRERKGLSLVGRIQQSFQREDDVLTFGKVRALPACSGMIHAVVSPAECYARLGSQAC